MSLLAWGVTGCVLLGFGEPAVAFTCRISRPVVEERLARGQTTTGTIEVENTSPQPVTVEVYLQDWEYLEGGSGEKLFSVPGSSPRSASAWISYYPKQLELPAQGKGLVEYTIRVPEDASGGHYAVLFFESVLGQAPSNEPGVTVRYTGRIGSLFEIDVDGTIERTGELSSLTVGRADEDRPLALSYAFTNTGNVVIRPKAYFNLVDQAGRYFGRGEFNPIYTFPGRSGSTKAEWTGSLPPGDYTVLLTVDLGGNEPLVEEHPLHVGREVAVETISLRKMPAPQALMTVHNTGNFHAECSGTLMLQTEAGQAVGTWPIPRTALAADERRDVTVELMSPPSPAVSRCQAQLACDNDVTAEQRVACSLE